MGAGSDLDGPISADLERHLAGCPACRRHRRQLEESLDVLQTPFPGTLGVGHDSVWPELSTRLPSRRDEAPGLWIPGMALAAAACLVLIVVSSNPVAERPRDRLPLGLRETPLPVQPVSNILPNPRGPRVGFGGDNGIVQPIPQSHRTPRPDTIHLMQPAPEFWPTGFRN